MEDQVQTLWYAFHEKLRGYIKSKVRDEELANDLLQEVFIKIQLNLQTIKDSTKVTSWVYQIARNAIADYYRKEKSFSDIDSLNITENELEANYNENFQNDVRPFIDQLPEKYREVLLLCEFQHLSQIELAERLGISYSAAKSRVQRAREQLKCLFTECCDIQVDKFGNIIDYQSRDHLKKKSCC